MNTLSDPLLLFVCIYGVFGVIVAYACVLRSGRKALFSLRAPIYIALWPLVLLYIVIIFWKYGGTLSKDGHVIISRNQSSQPSQPTSLYQTAEMLEQLRKDKKL